MYYGPWLSLLLLPIARPYADAVDIDAVLSLAGIELEVHQPAPEETKVASSAKPSIRYLRILTEVSMDYGLPALVYSQKCSYDTICPPWTLIT